MKSTVTTTPFGDWRPRLEDGPDQIKAKARKVAHGMTALAVLAPLMCLPRMAGVIGDTFYWIVLGCILIAAVPLAVQLVALTLRSIKIRARQQALTERDLDRVVAYAHRLGVSSQARGRAVSDNNTHLTYPRVESFLDWIEQQALLARAGGRHAA